MYKFCVLQCFADDPTHCGVIEAEDLEQACRNFVAWNRSHWDHEEFPLVDAEPVVDVRGEHHATVTYTSRWTAFEDEATGQDVYAIQPVDGPVFSLFAADWQAAFRS